MQKNYGLWVLVLLAGYLAFRLLSLYWQFLAFALIFAVLFYRPYQKLAGKIHPNLAALAVVIGVLLVLVIPSIYLMSEAAYQVPGAYQSFVTALHKDSVRNFLGVSGDELRNTAVELGASLRQNIVDNAAAYFSQLTTIIIGFVLMFIATFFFLRDGKKIHQYVSDTLPVRKHNGLAFLSKMHNIIDALLLGHLVTAVVQGVLAGLLFAAIGVPNALLLAIITILVSIIPLFGPFLTYIPVAGYLFIIDRYVAAIIVLAFGVIFISQIDNVIRPYIANRTAAIHPLIVIVGVIAGIKLMGVVGFVLGPLVLAGFFALFEFAMTGDESVLHKGKKR